MIIRPAAKRPAVFALVLRDGQIVYACNPPPHEPALIEFPVLVTVAAKPVAAVIMPFVGEANSDPIGLKGPQLLDEAVVEFPDPFSPEKRLDFGAARDELR